MKTGNTRLASSRGAAPKTRAWIETIVHYARLSRTYTWVDAITTGLIAFLVQRPSGDVLKGLLASALASLLLWLGLNWASEFTQRDEGRRPVPLWLASVPLALALVLVSERNLVSLVPLFGYWILAFVYPYKKFVPLLSDFCYFIRGAQTALHFAFVAALFGNVDARVAWIGAGLALLQASRSLIAEIRDAPFDRHGLPALLRIRLGTKRSFFCCIGISAVLGLTSGLFLGIFSFLSLLAFALLAALILSRHSDNLHIGAYHVHRFFLTASVIAKCLVVASDLSSLALLLPLSSYIIAQLEYSKVFRPVNALVARKRQRGERPFEDPNEVIAWRPNPEPSRTSFSSTSSPTPLEAMRTRSRSSRP